MNIEKTQNTETPNIVKHREAKRIAFEREGISLYSEMYPPLLFPYYVGGESKGDIHLSVTSPPKPPKIKSKVKGDEAKASDAKLTPPPPPIPTRRRRRQPQHPPQYRFAAEGREKRPGKTCPTTTPNQFRQEVSA